MLNLNIKHTLSSLRNIKYLDSGNFFLIAGPCVVENLDTPQVIAEKIVTITDKLKIPYIFKASYRKANRSSINSFTGIGDEKALKIINKIREDLNIPVLTDIHLPDEAAKASNYVDVLQIPAFLSRQTDLLVAAAKTDRIVNIKKGQFMNAVSMKYAVQKVVESGNDKIMLTDRGNMYGYNDLVVDMRNITLMKKHDFPVIMDITHSLQQPNQAKGVTGGQPEMIETIARAAIAVGADGLFIETHPNPAEAKSDGANMLDLSLLPKLLERLVAINKTINKFGD